MLLCSGFLSSGRYYADRMVRLGACLHLKMNTLACFQGLVSIHVDCGVVGENIVTTAFRANKPKSLCVVKPLHRSGSHTSTSLIKNTLKPLSRYPRPFITGV